MPPDAKPEAERLMQVALTEARKAADEGNTPVAALVVRDGEILAVGRNSTVTRRDPLAHAETVAIVAACDRLGQARLDGCTLYTTMEPCPMCAWAIRLAGIGTVVLGARFAALGRTDLGAYSFEKLMAMTGQDVELITGVCEGECEELRRAWSRCTGRVV